MRYVFSITFFMINGIIQAQKLVSQVYYLDQCQKYNNIKKEAPTTSTILSQVRINHEKRKGCLYVDCLQNEK